MRFKDKVVLVTGSSRGIGKAIALNFAKEGAHVIINSSKSQKDLLEAADEIQEFGGGCTPVLADVSNYISVRDMFEEIYLLYGKIDILINNAGISQIGLFTDLTEELWNTLVDTNLKSLFNCCHFALPKMISAKSGTIINISSIWGVTGASCEVAYSATKGGMNAFTKALAKELGPSNIRVNAIACGAIDTEMNKWLKEDELKDLVNDIPLMQLGTPQDVADLSIYLASDQAKYITGQVISLDGGMA